MPRHTEPAWRAEWSWQSPGTGDRAGAQEEGRWLNPGTGDLNGRARWAGMLACLTGWKGCDEMKQHRGGLNPAMLL